MRRRYLPFRLTRRTVVGIATLVVLTFAGAWWRATSIVNRFLRDWAVGVVAQHSDSVYRLQPVGVHVNWLLRRVRLDSARLTTSRGVNAHQRQPLAEVQIELSRCTINGVHFLALVRGASLIASSLGCATGSIAVSMPRRAVDTTTAPAPTPSPGVVRPGFLVLQQGLRLPTYLRRVEIRGVTFPALTFDFRIPRAHRGETQLDLERLEWRMTDFVIDPLDPSAGLRPLFSRAIELVAENFVAHPDSTTTVRVERLRTSLIDSTLEIRGIGVELGAPGGYRHDVINLTVGQTLLQGIDFETFAIGLGVRARRLVVDSLGVDVTSDKRLPRNPNRRPHRTPQQWMDDLDLAIRLDSVVVRNGALVYREHAAGRARAGVMTFAGIQATASDVVHRVDRLMVSESMSLAATARLQDAALLDVQFVIPLDAPLFDMTYRGTLGAMSATALNPFIEEVLPLRIANGQVTGINFSATVRAGVARGRITPRFTDLQVSVMRRGSEGILGGGGIIGGMARGIASFVANQWGVRGNNPDNPTKPPKSGRILATFRSNQTLPAFLWSGMRGGLLKVVKQ